MNKLKIENRIARLKTNGKENSNIVKKLQRKLRTITQCFTQQELYSNYLRKEITMRYQEYVTGNKVIIVSHYAGKPVRGIAKCNPKDEFDFTKGKKLAKARCDKKIAMKRFLRAKGKYTEATKAFYDVCEHRNRMQTYYDSAFKELHTCLEELEKIESDMKLS